MAINITPEERNFRFKITQLGRYLLAFFIVGLAFTLIFFSPTKDPAPYIGLAGTLIGAIVMFYFRASSSNEKMPVDATSNSAETDTVIPTLLPFTGNSPAANISSNTPRQSSTGELHAPTCGCGDCYPYVEPQYYNPTVAKPIVAPKDTVDFDAVIESLKADAKADGITWNPSYAAQNFKVWLFNHVTVGSNLWGEGLGYALDLANKAYKSVVGADAPTTYAPLANYNKFMTTLKKDTTNKYGCGKVPAEPVRVVVMTLREILKYYEEV